jgi:hypothetical protein
MSNVGLTVGEQLLLLEVVEKFGVKWIQVFPALRFSPAL